MSRDVLFREMYISQNQYAPKPQKADEDIQSRPLHVGALLRQTGEIKLNHLEQVGCKHSILMIHCSPKEPRALPSCVLSC